MEGRKWQEKAKGLLEKSRWLLMLLKMRRHRRSMRPRLADALAVGVSGKWDIRTHIYLTVKLTTFPNLHVLPLGSLFINLVAYLLNF